jgi:hypothetical protein
MVNLIWDYTPEKSILSSINVLNEQNIDGLVTVAEFALFCRHEKLILQPFQKLRAKLRKKIIFERYWMELTNRRLEEFQYETIFDILPNFDSSFVLSSLEFLALQKEVPEKLLEHWKFLQKKKKSRRKGCFETPHEMREDQVLPFNLESSRYNLDDRVGISDLL